MTSEIVFSGGLLDRVDHRRREPEWIAARLSEDETRVLAVYRGSVLVREDDPTRLAWATPELCSSRDAGSEPVLLGVADGVAHFAVDVSSLEDPVEEHGWEGTAGFPDLRATAAQLPPGEASIAAQARHVLDWHARHRFCSTCGFSTRMETAGWMRRCERDSCAAEHFPRTDPVVIMLVTDGDRCVLGRGSGWPLPFHSALAGFVEPGESLEEAVRREVHEEVGIDVGEVRYLASQPWPFPASLMIGCMAEASSHEIRVDDAELESAGWFSRDEICAALQGPTATLAVPPPVAIAHHLIRAWAKG